MLRTILGVVLGVIVAVIVVGVVEGAGHTIFPPPPGVNLTDPAQLATVMSRITFPAKIAVLLAWVLGVLAGASAGNVIAGRRRWAGRVVTLVVLALSVFNMTTIPHPVWFMIAAVVGMLAAGAVADRAFGKPRV